MSRVSDKFLSELIENEGELATGPINRLGILRLALDLRDARRSTPLDYYEITRADVGHGFITAFGRTWLVSDFMGRILERDIGKRVYLRSDVLQAENDEQLAARRAKSEAHR